MTDITRLTPATEADILSTLAFALRYDGRRPFKRADTMMAEITAAHLLSCLEKSGFVLMKKPPAPMHSASFTHTKP